MDNGSFPPVLSVISDTHSSVPCEVLPTRDSVVDKDRKMSNDLSITTPSTYFLIVLVVNVLMNHWFIVR